MTNLDSPDDFMKSAMPLAVTLNMSAVEISAERVVVEVDWAPELCTIGGVIHGGTVMTLADTAGATVAFMNLPEGAVGTSTIESKTNFMGAVTEGTLRAEATTLHVGRSTIVVETEVTNGSRLVAKVMQTQSVLQPRG